MARAIVVDNGSAYIKAGRAGFDAPCSIFPAVIGTPRFGLQSQAAFALTTQYGGVYAGDAAQARRGLLSLHHPIERGLFVEGPRGRKNVEALWDHMFTKALGNVDPTQQPILVTDAAPNHAWKHREHLLEIIFETFQIPALLSHPQPCLVLYSAGRTTGVVLNCGDAASSVYCVYDGFAVEPQTPGTANLRPTEHDVLTGRDLTAHLRRLLSLTDGRGLLLDSQAEHDITQGIKEKLCAVALDSHAFHTRYFTKTYTEDARFYELPDGNVLTVDTPRFACPEALFNPRLFGFNEKVGLHDLLYQAVSTAQVDLRRELANAIVLAGGTTLFPGFPERIGRELSHMCPASMNVRIFATPERLYSAWTGGSIFASLPLAETRPLTQQEYFDCGAKHAVACLQVPLVQKL